MSWWAFFSGSLLCLLTFISQVKSLTEVHPITLIFLRSVTTLAIITPVCTPSIYETKPNNTLYRAGFWQILWECFYVGRRPDIIKLINLVQIGIVRDQPPFPAGQSLQGFISNPLSTFSSGCQNPILLVFSPSLVFKKCQHYQDSLTRKKRRYLSPTCWKWPQAWRKSSKSGENRHQIPTLAHYENTHQVN